MVNLCQQTFRIYPKRDISNIYILYNDDYINLSSCYEVLNNDWEDIQEYLPEKVRELISSEMFDINNQYDLLKYIENQEEVCISANNIFLRLMELDKNFEFYDELFENGYEHYDELIKKYFG